MTHYIGHDQRAADAGVGEDFGENNVSSVFGGGSWYLSTYHLQLTPPTMSEGECVSLAQPALIPTCPDNWHWADEGKSPEANTDPADHSTINFHMNWSNGTAGIRGNRNLNDGCTHYWEVRLNQRVFGTSMMFGLATDDVKLHRDSFVNLFGQDHSSWALSHKGLLWHGSEYCYYTSSFRENQSVVVGLLYDSACQTLTYYKDGQCLGVAFRGLPSPWCAGPHATPLHLYPVVASTAAKTSMTLLRTTRTFHSLQDRCRQVILASLQRPHLELMLLRPYLPRRIITYLAQASPGSTLLTPGASPRVVGPHSCEVCRVTRTSERTSKRRMIGAASSPTSTTTGTTTSTLLAQ